MKEIFKITISLTMVCVVAALILGAVYAKTEHVRKENEEKIQQQTIRDLLGFSGKGDNKAPENLRVYAVYRYVLSDSKGGILLGYLMPLKDKGFVLAEIDLEGKPGKTYLVEGDAVKLAERPARDAAVQAVLPKDVRAVYAQTLFIANLGDQRLGYVIPGVTQGFKTFIKMMVSLDPNFTVTGIAITESEEDPGLGAEIEQNYFRNQFRGKTVESLKDLKVVKEPLPDDYFMALDPMVAAKKGLSPEKISGIKEKHIKDDIYALTGATISSKAVTNGVKDTVRKFVYRLGILNDAIKKENMQVAF
ncbi:MAG: H+/Na+-translocating ferredoxin:NAD+ oxidoreductase subunit [Thermodesulfobacteriota bacterium]|nr:H+/Na+-translocating ferredoxin:NAD+ oxidoreductase subunit [Thermodesulfobacteriota bacterium]